jgi:hypothetical protein
MKISVTRSFWPPVLNGRESAAPDKPRFVRKMNTFGVLKNDVYPGYPGITIRGGLTIYWGLTAKNPKLTVAATELAPRFAFPE